MPKLLKVRILSPQNTIYQGQAVSVSSINSQGKFDILSEHANFITIVRNQPIIIATGSQPDKLTFNFPLAIIYNFSNLVNIYTGL